LAKMERYNLCLSWPHFAHPILCWLISINYSIEVQPYGLLTSSTGALNPHILHLRITRIYFPLSVLCSSQFEAHR
jgi:hypothetical protein